MPQSASVNAQSATQIKYTIPFTSIVNAALFRAAAAERMEPTEIIQRATINSLIKDGFIEEADADRIKLFWELWLIERFKRRRTFALPAVSQVRSPWTRYTTACRTRPNWPVGPITGLKDIGPMFKMTFYKNGNPEKGPINREIGFRIRAGIGGIVEKGDDGKSKTTKVLGEIIQSYTPMADFDRVTFKPQPNS